MKRRTLLGTISIVAVPTAGATNSVYGTPASVTGPLAASTELLRLPLSSAALPADLQLQVNGLGALLATILSDPHAKTAFVRDPGASLKQYGLADVVTPNNSEAMLLKALADDDVLAASMSGDYKAFLSRLGALGVLDTSRPSTLKTRVKAVMRQHASDFQRVGAAALAASGGDGDIRTLLEAHGLGDLYNQLSVSNPQTLLVVVPVAIAAIVVAYVSVVVGATVAILAGVYISIAVSMGVVASQAHGTNTLAPMAHYASTDNSPIEPEIHLSDRQRQADRSMATRLLIGKRMLALDPDHLRQAQLVARAAKLVNQDAFILQANRQLVIDELLASVEAAEELGLLHIPAENRTHVLHTMETVALQAAGLA